MICMSRSKVAAGWHARLDYENIAMDLLVPVSD